MNQTLKKQLAKNCQEIQLKWPEALLVALLRIRIIPRARQGVSPFKLLYGKPYAVNELVTEGSQIYGKGEKWLRQHLLFLSVVLPSLHRYVQELLPVPRDVPAHLFWPGHWVLIWTCKDEPLKEKWKGCTRKGWPDHHTGSRCKDSMAGGTHSRSQTLVLETKIKKLFGD